MAEEIARLVAVVETNLRGFTKGMEDAQRVADRRFGQIERRLSQTERRFTGFGRRVAGIFAGALSIAGITRFVSSVSAMAGKLQDTSDALGVGTDALQTWGILAGRAGVGQEQFNKALANFSQRLGEAQLKGAKHPLAQLLNNIGVGTQGTPEQVFLRFSDAIKDTANQTQRAALVSALLGQRYVALTGVIQQGSAALRAQGEEFARNGSIMTRESIAKIDELGDKWEDLKRQFTAIGGNVLAGFADSFSQFATQLSSPAFQASLQNFGRVMGEVAVIAAKLAPFVDNIAAAFAAFRLTPGPPQVKAGAAVLAGLGIDLLGQAAKSVEELEAELAALKSTLAGGFTVVSPDEIAKLEKLIAATRRARAEAEGIPFSPKQQAPAATPLVGTIDRTGQLEEDTEATKRLRTEEELRLETLRKLEDVVRRMSEADADFRRQQGEEAQELRNRSLPGTGRVRTGSDALGVGSITGATPEELEGLEDFHARANAAWEDYWQRVAEGSQQAADEAQAVHDILKEDIADSILFLGEAALEGGDAFERALRGMIIQATLLAIKMNVLRPLLDLALGGAPGAGFLSTLFGGSRQHGGPVVAGKGYVVGEDGPEWFRPSVSGTIMPRIPQASVVGQGGGPVTLNMPIDARGAQAGVAEQIARVAPAIVAAAIQQVQRNFKPMLINTQRNQM